jgi:hypothetical protein
MNAHQMMQQSLFTSGAADGAMIFPTLLIDKSRARQTTLRGADQALEYYRSVGLFGERSIRNEHGYGEVIRSLNSEPPWVESIKMEEMEETSAERGSQLRPLTIYVQETSDEILFEQFNQHLLERDARFARFGFGQPLDQTRRALGQPTELDKFKSLIALARLLGPDLAYDLEQRLLYEFGDDSFGVLVGAGAPDLLLWTPNGDNEFWCFSEVKAPRDYLRPTQKGWLAQHWDLVQGHFLLTILA